MHKSGYQNGVRPWGEGTSLAVGSEVERRGRQIAEGTPFFRRCPVVFYPSVEARPSALTKNRSSVQPGSFAAFLHAANRVRSLVPGALLAELLTLDQPARGEGRSPTVGRVGEVPKPFRLDNGILVLAEDVLHLCCGLDESRGRSPASRFDEFPGVAGSLGMDSQLV
jgi:hypothetical protein